MSLGGYQQSGNDRAYSASPTNTARSRGKQIRPDDGFHTRPPPGRRGVAYRSAVTLAVIVGIVAVIFLLRMLSGA